MRTLLFVCAVLILGATPISAQQEDLAFRPEENIGLPKVILDISKLQQCGPIEQKYPPTGFLGLFFTSQSSIRAQECYLDADRQHLIIVASYYRANGELVGPIAFVEAFFNDATDEYEPSQVILNKGAEERGRISRSWYSISNDMEKVLRKKGPKAFEKLVREYG